MAQDAPSMRTFHLQKKTPDGRTDGPTDGPTDQRKDGRTRPLIEMQRRI